MTTDLKWVAAFLALALPVALPAAESPHWTANGCRSCHMEAAPTDGLVNLKESDAEALCDSCHGDRGDALRCRHSSNLPGDAMDIPQSLSSSLKDGQVVCSTCHDITYQCERPKLHYSFQNPGFLRDRKSVKAGDYCTKCHVVSDYSKLNPHQGVVGNPPRPTCGLCHEDLPRTGDEGDLVVKFNMHQDLNDTCRGCHVVRPHPKSMSFGTPQSSENWVHLVEPSAAVLKTMSAVQAERGIGLPLDPTNGKVFCATCHNPHDFKVGGEHGSHEREARSRLRLDNICQACHDK